MPERKRYFTVEGANQLIPTLEREIVELQGLQRRLEALGVELSPAFKIIHNNGGHPKTPEFLQLAERFRHGLEQIHSYGCHLKGVDTGLLDFPHLREGREVYLCWKLGEDEVRYWHDLETGYAGRQRIE